MLTRSEAERRQLEERVADLQSTVGELKRQKDQLSDSKSKAQQDLSNAEIRNAELEMSMKSLKGVSVIIKCAEYSVFLFDSTVK